MSEDQTNQVTEARSAELQQQWHGWGSPVGIGVGLFCLGAGTGAVLIGIAAISSIGAMFT